MSLQGFCTQCGAPRSADAKFCTSCGAAGGAAAQPAAAPSSSTAPTPVTAIAIGALLVVLGGGAAYFSLRTSSDVPRAVPGAPGTRGGGAPATDEGGLPSGHPSIELPKEVLDFLAGLAAEADKDPKSVDAAQKLARARYRASVINASYRTSAEQALAKLLALDPENAEGLRISANLAYDAGQFPEAQKRFRAFLEKYPDDVSAMTDLGSSLLFQDQVDEAIALYESAIAKDSKFMQAHFNLGIALQKKGKKDDAIASLGRALGLAETPDERQHVENALAELEGRAPMQIAGARSGAAQNAQAAVPAAAAPAAGMPGGAPRLQGTTGGAPAVPGAAGGAGMQGGMPMPPPAPDRDVPTNATTAFQRAAEKPLITHPIVGPRVVAFEWTGPSSARAKIADFPMDQMPPFARAKFKTGMTEKVAAAAAANGVAGNVTVEIVDNATGRVMETLDVAPNAAGAGAAPSEGSGAAPGVAR